jgi:hypothetical protein
VWVLSAPAKRWTAVLQPEEFDSPVLHTGRPAKFDLSGNDDGALTTLAGRSNLGLLRRRASFGIENAKAPSFGAFLLCKR